MARTLQILHAMRWMLLSLLVAVTFAAADPVTATAKSGTCEAPPAAKVGEFRHKRSKLLAKLGSPRHRGIDLIAAEGDEKQTLGGKLAYTKANKDLEDEDVEVFACIAGGWKSLGVARTDDDGRFQLVLGRANRLPVGMTALHAHVIGDGTVARFLGYVAARGTGVIVTDIDGTITESEDAVWDTVLFGDDIPHQPGAPETYNGSGKTIVYLSARGDQYTETTRRWLVAHGFPPGPIRHAKSFATLPGKRTVELKTSVLRALGVPIIAGIGNRASDIAAYENAGLTPDRIFINLPEFTKEVRTAITAKKATAFDDYRDLAKLLANL